MGPKTPNPPRKGADLEQGGKEPVVPAVVGLVSNGGAAASVEPQAKGAAGVKNFDQVAASPVKVPMEDTEIHTWFERDRANVELRHIPTEMTVVEWWDGDVAQAIEDGFLSGGRGPRMSDQAFQESAYAYAESVGLLDATRFYKGCEVDLRVHRGTLVKELDQPMTEQDLIHFMSLLDRSLKAELPGAKIKIRLAVVGADFTTAVTLDAKKKTSQGLADKAFKVFDECREDVNAWAGRAGVIDPKEVPKSWRVEPIGIDTHP